MELQKVSFNYCSTICELQESPLRGAIGILKGELDKVCLTLRSGSIVSSRGGHTIESVFGFSGNSLFNFAVVDEDVHSFQCPCCVLCVV